ncbi:hypothetical protein AUEXF2481DRAFT_29228 [Aureobasidium subglaciale EXF-2481]|uniref:Uncharacterized protein n=1 Tax=Aureobasidium subglaciale (strain EXF-2481) TaxID=1043005 RepID=A0A074YIB2_AURSE|nr:uncharacterized protein AUEXF2481DRAFT_29228 [Aureobasidium subglaciale EXF-2481]KAI5201714.1 hypothetical protein E4T38_05926 [Aureobasidium subglaciale]KAI5220539.1 hypothetical protein E4T40_05857 [Aureobasidium subglaciale]KAI5224265.1 hypothetical protein E4T41_05787 [Aureobasidium subglaciale]KAI5260745.1 hypothetical protein E4T46_05738 [Aureobasidium subglaciale]KEQ95809.1 hypothetical protein AUEXF2481DRAFT_29228 [Aureobasidium subglaciale EXF-2481]
MDAAKTIALSNGSAPLTTSTVNEKYTAAMASIPDSTSPLLSRPRSGEQDEDTPKTILNFEKPGPGTMFFCLVLNMLVTISWYYLNIDVSVADKVSIGLTCRYMYDGLVLVPMGLFSLLQCLYSFGTLLCLRPDDRALCIARVALGGMLGASLVVKYGLGAGVLDGSSGTQLCFWATTGVLPGAGAVALVGFCWDCLYWGTERPVESVVDEKRPLLEKQDV